MRPTNLHFTANRDVPPPTPLPYASLQPQSPDLRVRFGQLTFDAEGQEARGRWFSRAMHWPGGASGVTIGRGYDLGGRTRLQAIAELQYAGMNTEDASFFGAAAGLRGEAAARFVHQRMIGAPIISLPAQRRLFEEITTAETIADIRRIMAKPDVQAKYGVVSWDVLSDYARNVVFDLRYRGDYTPLAREVIQPLLVARDDAGLATVMSDATYWAQLNVPASRIQKRANMAVHCDRLRRAG